MIICFVWALVALAAMIGGGVITAATANAGGLASVLGILCLSPAGFIGLLVAMFMAGRASRRYRVVVEADTTSAQRQPAPSQRPGAYVAPTRTRQ